MIWQTVGGEGYVRARPRREMWPEVWERSRDQPWHLRTSMEFEECAPERSRRSCIINSERHAAAAYKQEPFANAPFVHPFRAPSYHAQQLPAISFAQSRNHRLLWLTAHDVPVQQGSLGKGEELEQRKARWLEFHDRKTSGVLGLLPLVLDLQIRFTEAPGKIAREMNVCIQARARVVARVGLSRGGVGAVERRGGP